MRSFSMSQATLSLAALSVLLLTGCPKPPPPKLPPKEVPQIGQVGTTAGERSDVVADAVQQGSNMARILFDCGVPHSQGADGKGVLSADLTKCEFDWAKKELTITDGSSAECPNFQLTITSFKGPGTYNTSSLGKLSFGTAKMRQSACNWDGNMCLDWNGTSGPHPESSCTIEVNSDGGLQYGTSGSTLSGTFVCDGFQSSWKGCAGAPAKVACVISRASFSAAGCNVINKEEPKKKPGGKKAK
ncbi:MAG TPA: hypothetical protein PKI49_06990 [Pseudomonadota bacterium]|jgi:hypothetical protein|nr:hypothetical protein [Pseudomonadota bacterium]HNF98284.1 hypothetical protein [Pseudomonadota bacterium]HNI59827.1 hypothetical protein [Pseudomonadota bacterium]HNK46557.1 hypothetical protein [Pseudomonadota bacterium]HNO68238.1 hypothetical protein [Pseudomonadota bacterium]